MSEKSTCPNCGAARDHGAPSGLCPKCLLGMAMSPTLQESETVIHETSGDLTALKRAILEIKLLDAGELEQCAVEPPGDATALARALVRAGKLTPYQAGALLQGKARGLVIGNYFVLGKLGAGGMGVVFKARHRRLGRIVALKILPPSFGRNQEMVLRFRREVEVAAQLSHPNIVSILDADEDRGVHFLTMEFIDGQDLDHLVRQGGALPVNQALDCVIQAARGLESAHSQGIVHRDIKPANLMLDHAGVVRVLDLGLARYVEGAARLGRADEPALTQSGISMGTVDFMAPEQAHDSKKADHRADMYSLGCSLYFLLTGRPPFDGGTVLERIIAHQERPTPSLRAAGVEASKALDAAYQKMMAKRPADRPRSMTEVIVLLEACRSSPEEAEEARSGLSSFATTLLKRAAPRDRKYRDSSVFARREEAEEIELDPDLNFEDLVMDYRPASRVAPPPPPRAAVPAPLPLPKRPKAHRPSRKVRPRSALMMGAMGIFAVAALVLSLMNRPDPRAKRPDALAPTRLEAPSARPNGAPSPVKKSSTVGRYVGTELFKKHTQRVKAIAVAKNGRLAISAGLDSTARLWDVETGAEVCPPFQHPLGRIVMDVAITPDGTHAITGTHGAADAKKASPNGAVRIWDTATGKPHLFGNAHHGNVNAVAVSPDGRRALSGDSEGELILWNLHPVKQVRIVGRQDGYIHEHDIVYFPDSRHAATAGADEFVHIWDVEAGKETAKLEGQHERKGCVAVSLDGLRMATGSNDKVGDPGYAYLWDVAGKTLIRRLSTPRYGKSLRVAFQSDGKLAGISNATGEVVLWDPETGALLRKGETSAISPSSIAALPGERLLTADGDGIVRLWTPRDPSVP